MLTTFRGHLETGNTYAASLQQPSRMVHNAGRFPLICPSLRALNLARHPMDGTPCLTAIHLFTEFPLPFRARLGIQVILLRSCQLTINHITCPARLLDSGDTNAMLPENSNSKKIEDCDPETRVRQKSGEVWPPSPELEANDCSKAPSAQNPPLGLSILDLCLSYFPIGWGTMFVSVCLYAWGLLGRWPVTYVDDPKWIGQDCAPYQELYVATLLSFFVLPVAVISGATLKVQFRHLLVTRRQTLRLVVFALGIVICLAILVGNPLRRRDWFFD